MENNSYLEKLLDDTIEEYKVNPVDILDIGDISGEHKYLQGQKGNYLRTIKDINTLVSTIN